MIINEHIGFIPQAISLTSVSTVFTIPMSVKGADEITFIVGMGTAIGGINSSVTIRQGRNVTACASTNSANVDGATAFLGSTAANSVVSAIRALITITTVTTDGETLAINGVQFTQSTAGAAATVTTGFGSSNVASDGTSAVMASLTSKINFSTFAAHQGITAEVVTSAVVRIYVDDTASTTVNCTSTAASPISAAYEAQQALISFPVDMLDSTSLFVCAQFTSADEPVLVGAVAMKAGNVYNPPPAHGVTARGANT